MSAPRDAEGSVLELTRRYEASREEVFRAFTEPRLARQFMGPKGCHFEEFDFSPAEGASYRIALRGPDGVRYVHVGEFLRVVPPSELVYTWRWTEGPLARNETLVELRFIEADSGTLVRLRHSRFISDAERDMHYGWRDSFDRLTAWLAERQRSA